MTTVVSVAQGGTGSNSAALARTALGVPPSAAYDQANTARDQANTARTQANSAYSDANTRLSASGGTLAGDLIITGNLTVSGNSTTLNAEILTIEDADIVLLSNVASTPALNAGIIVNRGTSTNTFLRWDEVTDKWGWSDDGSTTYKFTSALDAYAQANSAYGAANNRVLKAGDTMTGQLNISSGGLLVTGNANFDSATLFVDSVNDRIGIGTTSPGYKLDVNGDIHASNEIYLDNGKYLRFTRSSGGLSIQTLGIESGTDSVRLVTSGDFNIVNGSLTNLMTVKNGGNVGIGTTSPGTKLHILDSSGPVLRMVRTSNRFDIEADNNAMGFVSRDSATANAYFSGFTSIGIGTTSPSGLWSGDQRVLHLSSSGGTAAGIRISSVNATAEFFSSAGSIEWGLYSNSASPFTIYTNSSERLRITSGGNIGIGTSSVDYGKVHIKDGGITAAAISTGWPAYNAEAATQSKYVLFLDAGSNGSVTAQGQGPSVTLAMGGYYDSRGIITMIGAGGGSPSDGGNGYGKDLMVKGGNSDNGDGYIGGRLFLAGGSGYSGGAFGANYGPVVMQPQGGNVGIGTTSPGARLSVTNSNATSPTAEFGGNQIREFVRTGTQSSDATIRVDIAFASQGANWSSQLIEIAVSTSAGGSSSRYGGVVRYVLTSLTDLQGPTALASDLTGLTVATAFSGMEFRVTFATTGGNIDFYCVHVRVLSSNTSAPATSVVIS